MRFILSFILILTSFKTFANPTIDGFADIVEPLMPAVVNVYTVQLPKNNIQRMNPFANMPDQFSKFFEDFGVPFGLDEMYTNPKAMSLGIIML